MPICPKCRRSLDTPGFCPYDGTALVTELDPAGPPQQRPHVVIDSRGTDAGGGLKKDPYERLIGETLDQRYLIESRLGEGGMGVVFRARHVVIEKAVAIKVLKREVARDQNVVRRFVQEARAASRIGHPNIIDVTDFGSTPDGMTYQVMEYIEGDTLSAVMRREKRMPPSRVLPIIAQLCRALGAAHDKGIVHRDLKPENVFLIDRDGRHDFVKVVDFGIAKVQPVAGGPNVPRLTRAGSVFGTPEYMAPEQAAGKGDTDHRVDIYAIGTILYEALVGTVPHKGETPIRTLAMQLMDPILPPREAAPGLAISDALEAVVMKALAKDRLLRYQTTQEMIDALATVAGDVAMDQPLSASTSNLPVTIAPDTIRDEGTLEGADDDEPIELRKRSKRPSWGERRSKRPSWGERRSKRPSMGEPRDKPPTEPVPTPPPRVFTGLNDRSGIDTAIGMPPLPPTEPRRASAAVERPSRRWGALVIGLLLLGGATALVAFALVKRSEGNGIAAAQGPGRDAGGGTAVAVARDAGSGAVPATVLDAGAPRAPLADAGSAVVGIHQPVDHHPGRHDRKPDAGAISTSHLPVPVPVPSRPDAGAVTVVEQQHHPVPKGPDVEVQIMTDPRGGRLAADGSFGGPDGTTFRRPAGTVLEFTCRKTDKDGKVLATGKLRFTFGGEAQVAICHMRPITKRKCLEETKNPYDDC